MFVNWACARALAPYGVRMEPKFLRAIEGETCPDGHDDLRLYRITHVLDQATVSEQIILCGQCTYQASGEGR